MTLVTKQATAAYWAGPEGIAPRGTLVLIPGRGESPELYERFGRRVASDGYRVHAVADPVADPALATSQVLAVTAGVRPFVLVGSDTGAFFAAGLAASGQVTGVDALVLAGLPTSPMTHNCWARLSALPCRYLGLDDNRRYATCRSVLVRIRRHVLRMG